MAAETRCQENRSMDSGGTGLEQSPFGCGDGRGDSELTPGGAGDRRVSSNPIAKRGARKAFREFLNELGRSGKNHRNGRYQQRTRGYGDYLYAQDREKFDVEFAEAMSGNYTARGFDRAKWVLP